MNKWNKCGPQLNCIEIEIKLLSKKKFFNQHRHGSFTNVLSNNVYEELMTIENTHTHTRQRK